MRTPRVTAGGVLVHGFVNRERLRFTLRDLTLSTTVGTGTFGRVRIAQHVETNRWYALKILKKSEIVRLQQLEHIKNEVRSNGGGRERKVLSRSRAHATPYYPSLTLTQVAILRTIFHPFIVNLFGHMQDERRLYMLLEFVPGALHGGP